MKWIFLLSRSAVLMVVAALLGLAPSTHAQVSVQGQWSAVVPWPIVAIHSIVLPNGKLLVWPRDGGVQARLWDPASGGFLSVPVPINIFCAGHSFLPDGRLLVTGGHIADNVGEKTSYIFDYRDNSWTRVADMNAGRWYPTSCSLPNGEQLVISGNIDHTAGVNKLPQVWTGSGWRALARASASLPLYPFLHVAPNGKVFYAGPNTATKYLDTTGNGSWSRVDTRLSYRDYGGSVMYEPGKVLVLGGGDPPKRTAETIDLNLARPTWKQVGSMAFGRRQHNSVILPDGKVLVTGGTSGSGFNDSCNAVYAAEMWDPATGQFTTMTSAAEKRLYHSTAILLPDGRVLSGGGGEPKADNCPDADHVNVEFYSPPYFFKSTRPAIAAAPEAGTYGQPVFVETRDAASIATVTLTRLGAVTHSVDMNQRLNKLPFTQAAAGLNVRLPPNANVCPPGHYLLWILNGDHVPSAGKVIRIQ